MVRTAVMPFCGHCSVDVAGGPSCVEHSLSCADAWSRPTRSDEGRLLAHPDRFPSGIKNLSDYVHSKGVPSWPR